MAQNIPLSTINPETNLEPLWQDWQQRYVTTRDAGDAPRRRVLEGVDSETTFSEGQAYGMLLAVYFHDQTLFDGFWLYARDHLNENGLMGWLVVGDELRDSGAATDADVDMAFALLVACSHVQNGVWTASEYDLDYCQAARDMINAVWTHEIDKPGSEPAAGLNDNLGYEIIPGDKWCLSCNYPDGIVNLSYFAPGYFRLFAAFTGNDDWQKVIERNYEIANQAQGHSCAGLVSNWNTYDAVPQRVSWQGASSEYWGWDGARFAWRIAQDAYWYDSASAQETLQPIGNFFASVGIDQVRAEYRLDGTAVNSYRDVFFNAHAAAAIWAVEDNLQSVTCGDADGTLRSTAQQAFQYVLGREQVTYYSDSWRLLTLLLMSGQMPLPTLDGTSVEPTPTPDVTAEPTEDPTDDATEEATDNPPTATPQPPTATPDADNDDDVQTALRIQLRGSGPQNDQQAQFQYRLQNSSRSTQEEISVRFYFTAEALEATAYVFDVYYDSSEASAVSEPIPVGNGLYYFEVTYDAARLAPGAEWELHANIRSRDWQSLLTLDDDWWAQGDFSSAFTQTDYLPVYVNGQLVAGRAPDSDAAATRTP